MMKIVNKSDYLLCPIRSRDCVIAGVNSIAMDLKPRILRFLHKKTFSFFISVGSASIFSEPDDFSDVNLTLCAYDVQKCQACLLSPFRDHVDSE